MWLEDETTRQGVHAVVRGFVGNTKRVVSVVYAVVVIELKDKEMMLFRHRFNEFDNKQHRFETSKSWTLFKGYKVPEEWGGMPPKWHRIFSKGFLMRDQ